MASARKKYNPHKAKAQILQLRKSRFESALREALVGASLSWNSTWDNTEFHPTGFEKAMKVSDNNVDFICKTVVTWQFHWHIVVTIWAQDKNGKKFEQPLEFEEESSMFDLEDFIEGEVLQEGKAACRGKEILEWGYVAKIM